MQELTSIQSLVQEIKELLNESQEQDTYSSYEQGEKDGYEIALNSVLKIIENNPLIYGLSKRN